MSFITNVSTCFSSTIRALQYLYASIIQLQDHHNYSSQIIDHELHY